MTSALRDWASHRALCSAESAGPSPSAPTPLLAKINKIFTKEVTVSYIVFLFFYKQFLPYKAWPPPLPWTQHFCELMEGQDRDLRIPYDPNKDRGITLTVSFSVPILFLRIKWVNSGKHSEQGTDYSKSVGIMVSVPSQCFHFIRVPEKSEFQKFRSGQTQGGL